MTILPANPLVGSTCGLSANPRIPYGIGGGGVRQMFILFFSGQKSIPLKWYCKENQVEYYMNTPPPLVGSSFPFTKFHAFLIKMSSNWRRLRLLQQGKRAPLFVITLFHEVIFTYYYWQEIVADQLGRIRLQQLRVGITPPWFGPIPKYSCDWNLSGA